MVQKNSLQVVDWYGTQEKATQLDVYGRIIDFLDPERTRDNKPEERVRQSLARNLHFDLAYPKRYMAMSAAVAIGTEKKEADLVVYSSSRACKERDQSKIAFIAETKAPDLKTGKKQLFSYIFATSAEGGLWTNGDETAHWRRQQSPQDLINWPGIPRFGWAWDSVGSYKKGELQKPHNLKFTFRKCHNALYRSGISSEDVAMDMVRILLAKQRDELNPGEECEFHCTPSELQTLKGQTAVADRVGLLFDQVKTANRDVFDVHERITARDQDVAVVTALLQEYSILEADYDVIGTAYETYVASHLRGKRGQFFTPRIVVRLMVRMVGPHEGDIILDLACGSGGFLIECLTQLRNKIEHSRRSKIAKQEAKSQIRNNLFGAEISPRLVKVAQANMLLGKDGHSNIVQGDSLRPPFEQLPKEFLSRCNPGVPTVVLTNPPFGAGAYHRITNKEILSTFLSGSAWEQDEDTGEISFPKDKVGSGAPPEILFLERCIQWSASGGKIGIVMARGQLDNKEAKGIRHIVLQECRITAIVNCHEDTFEPFVGSKASLLILEKKSKHEARDYRIFMAISKKCGQTSRGEPLFKRTQDGKPVLINGQPVLDHDMDEILEAFYNFQTGRKIKHPYCFSVRRSQIDASTLSLNPVQYLPHFEESRRKVIQLGESEEWEVRSLGDIADAVFNGPRFVRTGMHADEGITSGPSIVPYYTGTAMTQSKSENVKYFDIHKANKQQKKHLRKLRIFEGWILITDSRTLGRIIMARKRHHGAIATNNLIRVVINDQLLRGYVYEFLQSPYGQHQMLRNEYGTNQSHLEPEHVQNLLVPIPKDRKKLEEISKAALESVDYMERSMFLSMQAKKGLTNMIDGNKQIEEESEAQQGNLSLYPLDPKEALGVFMKVDPEKVKQREKEEKRRKKK